MMYEENDNQAGGAQERPAYDAVTGERIFYDEPASEPAGFAESEKTAWEEADDVRQENRNEAWQHGGEQQPGEAAYTAASEKAQRKAARIQARTERQLKKLEKKKNKKRSVLGKCVRFTAAGIAFGLLAGSVMYGVCYAGNIVLPIQSQAKGQESITIPGISEMLGGTSGSGAIGSGLINGLLSDDSFDLKSIIKANMPAMVAITGKVTVSSGSYFYGGSYESPVSGTGVIIGQSDTELFMVTNAHVVDGVGSLAVTFIDETTAPAAVKGSKSDKDIAVVSVNLKDLSDGTKKSIAVATIGNSDEVEIGDQVVAIGNAMGEGQSATVGWISALNRTIVIDKVTYSNLFMTDAAINPGNSGGALLNSKGQLIGINSAKKSSTEVEGMGYAIPISTVSDIIDRLIIKESRQEVSSDKAAYLGIRCKEVTSAISAYYGYPQGVFITEVTPGSAAEKAGLQTNDIIVNFDDNKISTYSDLTNILKYYAAGESVVMDYYHYENSTYTLMSTTIVLGSAKDIIS